MTCRRAIVRAGMGPGARGLEARSRGRPTRSGAVWLLRIAPTFVSGQAAMITDWGDIGTLSYAKDSKVKGKTGTTLTPGASKVYDRPPRPGSSRRAAPTTRPISASRPGCSAFRPRPRTRRRPGICGVPLQPRGLDKLVAYPDSGIQPSRTKTIEDPQPLIDAGMDPADAKQYLEAHRQGGRPPQRRARPLDSWQRRILQSARRRGVALHGRRDQRRAGDEERCRRLERDHRPSRPRQPGQALQGRARPAEHRPGAASTDAAHAAGRTSVDRRGPKRSILPVGVHHAGTPAGHRLDDHPAAVVVALSFLFWDFGNRMAPVRWAGLSHWARLVSDKHFHYVLLTTLLYFAIGIPVQFLIGLGLARSIDRARRQQNWLRICSSCR